MTSTLRDAMHERADRLDPHAFDVDRMVRDGDRQVRRRRTALVGGGAALAVAAAIGVATLIPQDSTVTESRFAAAFSAKDPVYAIGSTVHIDGRRFDVGHEVFSMVQSTHGVVVTDPDGTVYASSGEEALEVGRTHARHPLLVTDGSLVAWMERDGDQPVYAVLDQATGEVTRDSLEITPEEGRLAEQREIPLMLAVDGDTVYVRDSRGLVAWRPASGEERVVGSIDGVLVDDVQAGQLLRTESSRGGDAADGDRLVVGPTLDDGTVLNGASSGFALSPDAAYVVGESEPDVAAVFDTRTGERIPVDRAGYDFVVGYGWVDGDTWAGIGLPASSDLAEGESFEGIGLSMITCDVGGRCRTVAEVGSVDDGVIVPLGTSMDE